MVFGKYVKSFINFVDIINDHSFQELNNIEHISQIFHDHMFQQKTYNNEN